MSSFTRPGRVLCSERTRRPLKRPSVRPSFEARSISCLILCRAEQTTEGGSRCWFRRRTRPPGNQQLNQLYKNHREGVAPTTNASPADLRLTESSGRKCASSSIFCLTLPTCWRYRRFPGSSIKYDICADEASLSFYTLPLLCANSSEKPLEAAVCSSPSAASATATARLWLACGSGSEDVFTRNLQPKWGRKKPF